MEPVTELDYSLWTAYMADCAVNNITPRVSDYMVWLQEADLDRSEQEQE